MAQPPKALLNRSLDLNLLRTFVVLWHTRSVVGTSERLNVTQPAISHALKRLRATLGDELFVSGNKGLTPTTRASELIGPISEALERIYGAVEHRPSFIPEESRISFRIAALDYIELWLMPLLIEGSYQFAPGIGFHSQPVPDRRATADALESGEAHIVIDSEPVTAAGIISEPLTSIPVATLFWKRAGLTEEVFPLDLYLSCPQVMSQQSIRTGNIIEAALAEGGMKRVIAASVASNLTMASIAARCGYICNMPVKTAEFLAPVFGLSIHTPPIPLQEMPLHYAWHRRSDQDPAHMWLRGQIRKAFTLEG